MAFTPLIFVFWLSNFENVVVDEKVEKILVTKINEKLSDDHIDLVGLMIFQKFVDFTYHILRSKWLGYDGCTTEWAELHGCRDVIVLRPYHHFIAAVRSIGVGWKDLRILSDLFSVRLNIGEEVITYLFAMD